jgi:hypothetical protein
MLLLEIHREEGYNRLWLMFGKEEHNAVDVLMLKEEG